ncbi:MAG: response regulator, partial [Muribaculaceae bacterium]|nr:response regulator [Muribaculaceae bacterium]
HIPSERGICALYQADDAMLYAVSISDAIYRIDPSDGSVRRMLDLEYSSVRYSLAGGGSMPFLYIGIHGVGVMKYDVGTGEKTMYNSRMLGEDRLHNDWIASSYIDSKKRLWIGLYSGLACYDIPADTFRVIGQTPFVSLGACNAIREIRDGRLLIGTSCGLVLYSPDNDAVESVFTTSDGLCDNDVRTLEVDPDGVAWIGTMRGLSRLSATGGRISSLQGGHGLGETTFLHSGFSREKGMMYYAGNLGYTVFQPSMMQPVSFQRPVRVSAVYLNGHRLTESHLQDGRPAVETDESRTCHRINIAKDDNNLMLHLSTMDYRDPANVSYEWRFEGADDTWFSTKPGSGAIVIPGLPPGDHTLLVRATDNSMHSDITRLTIHVTPPWYLSVPAKVVYALVLAAVLVLVFIIMRKKKNEEIYEAKVKFFMDISHEIRSPVTCIISPLETLVNKEHDPETTAMLRGMQRNAGRILSLANQLLEIRKIDKGKKRLFMQPTDLVEFASELVEIYRPMARSKSIDISLDAGQGVEEVWIDRDNFDKVLVNLITNAIKYTPDGGQVRVLLDTVDDSALGECARIQVIDTGIGLDPKHITRIFDRFYQGQRSPGGFGVGLNLARQLVSLHHGSLTASNRRDGVKGSVFTVLLPLGNSHLTLQETQPVTAGGGHVSVPGGIGKKGESCADAPAAYSHASRRIAGSDTVLIVDDDRELREYLSFHFSRFCNVLEASDGAEALQLLHDNKVDIVISDVVMPGTDGLALLKSVKTNTMTTHIPVILLSSRNDVADRMQGWEQGADGYIGKPFTITELETLVDSLIRNRLRIKGKYTGAQDNCSVEPAPDLMGNDQLLLEKITKVIETRVEDSSFNVETLGVEVGISRAHLHRKMKSLIVMTPSD